MTLIQRGGVAPGYMILRGAKTLSEAAQILQDYADWLRAREAEGWQLSKPMGDVGYLVRESS